MSQTVRVGFVIPRLACGGVETFLLRLCPRLRDHGYAVEIVTTEEPGEWFDRFADEFPTIHIGGADQFPRFAHPFRVGRRLAGAEYDVLFVNSDPLAQQCLTMLPDHVVAIPVVHSDRGTAYRIAFTNHSAWNALVAVGPRIGDVARETLPERPVLQILPGVEMPPERDWRRRRAMTGNDLRVIFVGRLVADVKNVMILPAVIRQCRDRGVDAHLTVAGDGPDCGALKKAVQELSLTRYVDFVGEVPPRSVYDLLLDHHALVLPSFYEGLASVLLEAQACGTVPVASLLPGVTTAVVEEGRTGRLVSPTDAGGFATALARLWGDPPAWRAMSVAGHVLTAEQFSLDRMAHDYVRTIEDALSGRYPLPRSRRGRLPVAPSLYRSYLVPSWVRDAARWALRRQ